MGNAMECFYLITNSIKDKNLAVTDKVRDFLVSHGKKCIVHVADEKKNGSYTEEAEVPKEVDCVIVLGGDGTLIQAARDMVTRDIPLLGINLGTLGFLADIEQENLIPSLANLISGEYEIEERMMLEGTVTTSEGTQESVSLNDIVINRYGPLRVVKYNIYVNGKLLNTYLADGIIVSTPTGSTGYSLSAGGPIVEPKARMMVITPICPHTLNTRSVVLSAEDSIRMEAVKSNKSDGNKIVAEVSFDGASSVMIREGDFVDIGKSDKSTKIMKMNKESFLTVLRNKFSD